MTYNYIKVDYMVNIMPLDRDDPIKKFASHPLYPDCVKIAEFLMDESACLKWLQELNDELQRKLGASQVTVNLLRFFLEDELAKFGFQPLMAKGSDLVSPNTFAELLEQGYILKDTGLGGNAHGEFTHAIQWLMIARQQQATGFLSKDVLTIYQHFGTSMRNTPVSSSTLWDHVVDNTREDLSFRSPEVLHMRILHEKGKLPLLARILQMRFDKRSTGKPSLVGKHTAYEKKLNAYGGYEGILYPRHRIKRDSSTKRNLDQPEKKNPRANGL